MKQITEQLFAIEVPIDANCTIDNNGFFNILIEKSTSNFESTFLPKGNYKILGTAQLTNGQVVFDFDVEPFMEIYSPGGIKIKAYTDFMNIGLWKKTPQESFISLLESKDIYFVNPLGEKPIVYNGENFDFKKVNIRRKWKIAESKVVKGKLLIIEKQ